MRSGASKEREGFHSALAASGRSPEIPESADAYGWLSTCSRLSQKAHDIGDRDRFPDLGHSRKTEMVKSQQLDSFGMDHRTKVIYREVEPHVCQRERLHIARVKPPCRERPGID